MRGAPSEMYLELRDERELVQYFAGTLVRATFFVRVRVGVCFFSARGCTKNSQAPTVL